MISPIPSIDLTPILTATPTASLTPTPTILVATSTPTPVQTSAFGTLAWGVLILLGGAVLGIFGFLMGQTNRKAE